MMTDESLNVAILGANGFVGGHLLRALRASGDHARAVVRNPHFAPQDKNRRVADACDVYALRDALAGCDYAVHAVLGSPDVILGSLAPLYAAAQAVGIKRIVYISTGSVHGQSPAPGTDESSPLTVRHAFPYNTAKVRAERKLRRLRARGTVEIVILRPTIVFGPGSRWVFDFADDLHSRTAYLVSGAYGICNSIYVDNLAHAVRLALRIPDIDGEVFLVGDQETVTWRDLYRPIAEAFDVNLDLVPSVSPPDSRPGFKELYVAPFRSSELTQTVLRHVPSAWKTAIRRGIRAVRPLERSGSSADPISSTRGITVTPEMAALHCCRWRLPQDKAHRLLGYAAPISFDEGCKRSVAWLIDRERRAVHVGA
jgi:nucleoside-diphosphate-sugar epimerase